MQDKNWGGRDNLETRKEQEKRRFQEFRKRTNAEYQLGGEGVRGELMTVTTPV